MTTSRGSEAGTCAAARCPRALVTFSLLATTATFRNDDQQHLYGRSSTVVTSQFFGGTGLAVGVTVGALLARGMLVCRHRLAPAQFRGAMVSVAMVSTARGPVAGPNSVGCAR